MGVHRWKLGVTAQCTQLRQLNPLVLLVGPEDQEGRAWVGLGAESTKLSCLSVSYVVDQGDG
jgi:hypothetical protein